MVGVSLLAFAAGLALASASCAPEMFWVNFLNTPDQMVVSWTTNCSADSTVMYGKTPGSLTQTATGVQGQYTFPGDSYTSPYIHHTILANLPPSTVVYYRVGGSQSGYSDVMNFTTHPGVGPNIYTRYAVIGDLGQTSNSQDTLNHIQSASYPFTAMIHVGDLSYADNDEPRWDSWQRLTSPISQSLPWMTIVGNHEIELDINLKTFEAYSARWLMPYVNYSTPAQSSQLWYSVQIGSVYWLMLSSYSDYATSSLQYQWLVRELAKVDRSVTPWLFVTFHAPWYNSNKAHQGEGEPMRKAMETLLYNAGVDVMFSGHVHAYERCTRSYNMNPDPNGAYHITIGDGGNREGLAMDWISPQPSWSVYRQSSYGHGEIEVINSTHAHWTWHQNPDLEPTIADDLWIVKGQTAYFERPVTGVPRFRTPELEAAAKAVRHHVHH